MINLICKGMINMSKKAKKITAWILLFLMCASVVASILAYVL